MTKYVISEIYSDGYERFALIQLPNQDVELNVHFIECDEYLENGEDSRKKKKGDILKGNISIDLVTFSQKVNGELSYHQKISKSPQIEAIIKVEQIINEYSLSAISSLSDKSILVEFENTMNYKEGDKILIMGSLEINETYEEPPA